MASDSGEGDGEVKFNKGEKRLIIVVGLFLAVVWIASTAGGAR